MERAREALIHYLQAHGRKLILSAAEFLREVPTARGHAKDTIVEAAEFATKHSKNSGATKFTLSHDWINGKEVPKGESLEWFGVYRGYSYRIDGDVTVKKSKQKNGPDEYEMKVKYFTFKHFNFDAGESFPFPVNTLGNGTKLQDLHRTGLARNFIIESQTQLTVTWCAVGNSITPAKKLSIRGQVENQLK